MLCTHFSYLTVNSMAKTFSNITEILCLRSVALLKLFNCCIQDASHFPCAEMFSCETKSYFVTVTTTNQVDLKTRQ